MSYFEGQGPRWTPQHGRQQSWDPSHGPPRSGSSRGRMPQRYKDSFPDAGASATLPPEDPSAFLAQYEEVDRANDNLAKSTRMFGMPDRRDSLPPPGPFARQYPEFDPRMGGPSRHRSIGGEFDGMRSHSSHSSSSVQGYLAHQRFPPRMNEQDQLAKRRAAAQRERELRNYHQEQQYNRNSSAPKPERSQSPSNMSEEDRRELIARQHRALYGNDSNLYMPDNASARPMSQDARVLAGSSASHGPSPMNYDGFGAPGNGGAQESNMGAPPMGTNQPRSRSNSTSSPAMNPNAFAMYENSAHTGHPTSSSSPGTSPTRGGAKLPPSAGVAPIGTRPLQAKRNTPPMPSPLNHGYTNINERSQSSASNPTVPSGEKPPGLGWGGSSNNGPWGNSKAQASVWG